MANAASSAKSTRTGHTVTRARHAGGSLVPGIGGHNPFEAARLDCPFVAGPHVEKWPIYADLAQAGATRLVAPGELVFACDTDERATAKIARAFVAARDVAAGVALDRIVAMARR